jgi:hypothetical protein
VASQSSEWAQYGQKLRAQSWARVITSCWLEACPWQRKAQCRPSAIQQRGDPGYFPSLFACFAFSVARVSSSVSGLASAGMGTSPFMICSGVTFSP